MDGEGLRLLITDPFHPVVAATVGQLRERLGLCGLIGVSPAVTPGHRPPPGVDAVYSCPSPDGAGFIEAVRDVVQREAVHVVLPWTDLDALVLASAHKALADLGEGLSWSGLANVQLVIAEGHRPTVYEINARAAGSIGISTHAGVDLLSAAIRMALVGTIGERPEMVTVERTVAFRRHWHDQVWPTAPTAEVTA